MRAKMTTRLDMLISSSTCHGRLILLSHTRSPAKKASRRFKSMSKRLKMHSKPTSNKMRWWKMSSRTKITVMKTLWIKWYKTRNATIKICRRNKILRAKMPNKTCRRSKIWITRCSINSCKTTKIMFQSHHRHLRNTLNLIPWSLMRRSQTTLKKSSLRSPDHLNPFNSINRDPQLASSSQCRKLLSTPNLLLRLTKICNSIFTSKDSYI